MSDRGPRRPSAGGTGVEFSIGKATGYRPQAAGEKEKLMKRHMKVGISLAFAALVAAVVTVSGQGRGAAAPAANGYIGGVVQGVKGPEAGVWVIAETKDLPTNFIKIVVTDDRGRFMLPELPSASYSVWVRGYGLVDSAKTQVKPSATAVTLRVNRAKTPLEAAQVYPGNY